MAYFDWNNSFSVGVTEIDQQHKRLVASLNELYEAMSKGKGRDVVDRILTGLVDYTGSHFTTEEKLMISHSYPDMSAHFRQHQTLKADVIAKMREFSQTKTGGTIEIVKFLKDWLSNHIMVTDKKFGQFLNSKGVK